MDKKQSGDTLCFDATIHFNGVLVGTVANDGKGGDNHIVYTPEAPVDEIRAHIATRPLEESFYDSPEPTRIKVDEDFFYALLAGDMEEYTKLVREALSKTLFRVKGKVYKRGTWQALSGGPFDQRATNWLNREYGAEWVVFTPLYPSR